MKYKVNVGISWEPPGKPIILYWPGDVADLTDWPDLEQLQARGTITPVAETINLPAPEGSKPRSRRVTGEGSEAI